MRMKWTDTHTEAGISQMVAVTVIIAYAHVIKTSLKDLGSMNTSRGHNPQLRYLLKLGSP